MSRTVSDDERRARLGRRHRLAALDTASSPLEVTRALTAIHGTDPGSTVLGILARAPGTTIAEVETALYDERSLVRVLGMRRTIFAVDHSLAPAIWSAFERTVARTQRQQFARMLETSGVTNTAAFIAEAERRLLDFLDANPGKTSTEIASDDPYLSHRLPLLGAGGATSQSVTSRLVQLMSAEGRVIRGIPKGGWTSAQFTWVPTHHWRSDWPTRPKSDDADVVIARSWLYSFGPATVDDFAWWTGFPKGRSKRAIDACGSIEVITSEGPAYVRDDDLDPVATPEPWVALLPGLDSSTMGWKRRDFYLGQHVDRVFDNVGNGGPTVWVDGRIVGGWIQRENGRVVYHLFEAVDNASVRLIQEKATRLEEIIAGTRIRPRARRWTKSELELREKVSD